MPTGCVLKARPATEGDRRIVYCEPSTEEWDAQGEKILQKALALSVPHYLKFGNLDLDHLSLIGPKVGLSPAESKLYEIGFPLDVRTEPSIVLKGEVYRGEGKGVEQANFFWDTLTKQSPPRRWFPSVGGRPTAPKETTADGAIIKSVLWVNTGFAREPVNRTVKAVSLSAEDFIKAITAGYGTDSAGLSGGAALRRESLQGAPIRQVQGGRAALRMATQMGTGACKHLRGKPKSEAQLIEHLVECEGLAPEHAKSAARRVLRHLAHTTEKPAARAA